MAKPASDIARQTAPSDREYYEQPVSERMRTFMRLDFLYQLRGQTQDERFAVFGTRVAALFDKAATRARAGT